MSRIKEQLHTNFLFEVEGVLIIIIITMCSIDSGNVDAWPTL